MSGDKIKSTRPSEEYNEEMINHITEDLETICDIKSDTNTEHTKPEKDTESCDDGDISLLESDYVDEEALKEEEFNLTPDEKFTRKQQAETYKIKGNEQFLNSQFQESIESYTLGLRTCPLEYCNERSILYANRAASKMKIGLDKSAIEDCTKAIELNSNYIKAYYRRAQLYEQTDKLDESMEDFKKILMLDSKHKDALSAISRLPPLIEARNEKLKTEMLGKLKDLGNMILKPFGLSTSNFEMKQDPSSGSYSINFNQNQ